MVCSSGRNLDSKHLWNSLLFWCLLAELESGNGLQPGNFEYASGVQNLGRCRGNCVRVALRFVSMAMDGARHWCSAKCVRVLHDVACYHCSDCSPSSMANVCLSLCGNQQFHFRCHGCCRYLSENLPQQQGYCHRLLEGKFASFFLCLLFFFACRMHCCYCLWPKSDGMITRPLLQDDYIFAYCIKEAIVKQEEHDNAFQILQL